MKPPRKGELVEIDNPNLKEHRLKGRVIDVGFAHIEVKWDDGTTTKVPSDELFRDDYAHEKNTP